VFKDNFSPKKRMYMDRVANLHTSPHSVTYHPTQVDIPRLNPSQTVELQTLYKQVKITLRREQL